MKNHAKASTFAIRTSQPHKAKIAKELALPTHHDTTKMDRQTTYREEGRTANNQSFVGSERPTMKLLLNGSFGSSFQELWGCRKIFK